MVNKRYTLNNFETAIICAGLVHYKNKAKEESKKQHPSLVKGFNKLSKKLDCRIKLEE